MSARLDGNKRLNKAFNKHVDEMEKRTDAALESGGHLIANDAFKKSPYETGNLRSSIKPEVEGEGASKQVIIGTEVDYAPHQEYGTFKMKAQPFLRPAFDSKKEQAIKEIDRALGITLRKWQ